MQESIQLEKEKKNIIRLNKNLDPIEDHLGKEISSKSFYKLILKTIQNHKTQVLHSLIQYLTPTILYITSFNYLIS